MKNNILFLMIFTVSACGGEERAFEPSGAPSSDTASLSCELDALTANVWRAVDGCKTSFKPCAIWELQFEDDGSYSLSITYQKEYANLSSPIVTGCETGALERSCANISMTGCDEETRFSGEWSLRAGVLDFGGFRWEASDSMIFECEVSLCR